MTFQPIENAPAVDCWNASAHDFQTFVQQFADIDNVNTELWPLGERLYFINHVWDAYEEAGESFPFTVGKMLTVNVDQISDKR